MQVSTKLAVLLCASILAGCSSEQSIIADPVPRPVKVQIVNLAQQYTTLTFPSRLQPVQRAELAFRVPGTVTNIPVIEGQKVRKGDVLAGMDPHDFNVMVTEWEARHSEAKTVLAQAESERHRVVIAMEQDALASVELDRAHTGVERAKAGVEVARQRLQSARDALRYSRLKAPYDGVVAKVKVEPFEQAMPGISVMTFYGGQGYEIIFDVPDTLAQKIIPGMIGRIQFQQQPGNDWPVEIKEIASAASLLAKTYRVTARLQKVPEFAWPDMTAELTVDIPVAEHISIAEQSSMLLPATAVTGEGPDASITVIEHGVARKMLVTITGFEKDQIRIKGDIKPGMMIAVAGVSFLEDGQLVGELINIHDRVDM